MVADPGHGRSHGDVVTDATMRMTGGDNDVEGGAHHTAGELEQRDSYDLGSHDVASATTH